METQPQPEKKKYRQPGVLRAAGNIASMLSSDVAIRATNFVMYVLVGRYLGAFQLGQLSLAMTLFYSVHRFALVGLKTLITREVAKDRQQTGMYFMNSSIIVAVASIICSLIMIPIVKILNYSQETATAILLLFWGLAPFTLSQICEGIFQAWEKMELIAYAQVPLNLMQFAAVAFLLMSGFGIVYIIIAIVVSYVIILIVEWWFLARYITKPSLRLDIRFSKNLIKSSYPFLGIQGTNAIKSSVNIVLLSKLLGEAEVGIFSAANQLLAPIALIFNNVVNSIFPVMVRKFKAGIQGLERITEYLLEFLLAIALPAVVGLLITADDVLLFLYDDPDFLQAVLVLRILVWLPLGDALTTALGQVLWASNNEKTTLRISVVNTLVKVIVGFILIQEFGLIGAAITTAVVLFLNLVQHYLPVSKLLSGIKVYRLIWRPLVATLGMVVFVLASSHLKIITRALSAGVFYAIFLALVFILSTGGLASFKERYQYLWARGER